jgi:hypothetical protein
MPKTAFVFYSILALMLLPLLGCGKEAHQKKHEEPLTDFELSVTSVSYSEAPTGLFHGAGWRSVEIYKKETGVFARYEDDEDDDLEVELSMEEWMDFIRGISKCRIDEWEKEYNYNPDSVSKALFMSDRQWILRVISSDKDKSTYNYGRGKLKPANWNEFEKVMNGMKKNIQEKMKIKRKEMKDRKKNFDASLSAEYQKKFGKQISELESSIRYLRFEFTTKVPYEKYNLNISNSKEKASIFVMLRTVKTPQDFQYDIFEEELNMEEWLDFIHALHESRFYEWEEYYYKEKSLDSLEWELTIESNKNKSFESRGETYPPNWDKVKKIMDDMAAKIKGKTAVKVKEANAKLSEGYQKKFGEAITEPELSTTEIYFWLHTKDPFYEYRLLINRKMKETNAELKIFSATGDSSYIETELNMEKWLDFIRVLHKSRFYEWKEYYGDKKQPNDFEWKLDVKHLDKELFTREINFKGIDEYPENWDEFKKTIMEFQNEINR